VGLEPTTYGLKQPLRNTPDDTNEHGVPPSDAKVGQSSAPVDAVEAALASALTAASAAGQWQVVAQLASELEARRRSRQAPEVVSIAAARAKRNGGQP
jgi:hypothetical protein